MKQKPPSLAALQAKVERLTSMQRKGGQSRSKAKVLAARKNLAKARKSRHKKAA